MDKLSTEKFKTILRHELGRAFLHIRRIQIIWCILKSKQTTLHIHMRCTGNSRVVWWRTEKQNYLSVSLTLFTLSHMSLYPTVHIIVHLCKFRHLYRSLFWSIVRSRCDNTVNLFDEIPDSLMPVNYSIFRSCDDILYFLSFIVSPILYNAWIITCVFP